MTGPGDTDISAASRHKVVQDILKLIARAEHVGETHPGEEFDEPADDVPVMKDGRLPWKYQKEGKLGPRMSALILTKFILWALKIDTSRASTAKSHEWLARRSLDRLKVRHGNSWLANTKHGPWTSRNMRDWTLPTKEGLLVSWRTANRIRDYLARQADKRLKEPTGSSAAVLAILNDKSMPIERRLQTLVDLARTAWAHEAENPALVRARSSIDASLLTKPHHISANRLDRHADTVREHLVSAPDDRTRTVIITGPPYSGKRAIVSMVLNQEGGSPEKARFLINGGKIKLPILGLALDGYRPEQFVDTVHKFYGEAVRPEVFMSSRERSCDDKMKEIAEWAKEMPALVILADVGTLEQNELVRAYCANHIGKLFTALVGAHMHTRLIVTTVKAEDMSRELLRLTPHARQVRLQDGLPLREVLANLKLAPRRTPEEEPRGNPRRRMVSWVSIILANHALRLGARRGVAGEMRHSCMTYLPVDQHSKIAEKIGDILSIRELVVVGLIASSEDGVRMSVLERMAMAMHHLQPDCWPNSPPRRAELEVVLAALWEDGLISGQKVDIDPVLAPSRKPMREEIYCINGEMLRRCLLQVWFRKHREFARAGLWMIAREASNQSRAMRVFEQQRGIACFQRDLQGLHALIGSVDRQAAPALSSRNADRFKVRTVLPPLEEKATMPSPALALRCALYAYELEIERGPEQLVAAHDDAITRVGVLLRLFTPGMPWARLEELKLDRTLVSHSHLTSAFPLSDIIKLLSSLAIGALRLQRYDIVCNAVHLGKVLVQNGGSYDVMDYMRLVRTEIDAAILLGGNPESVLPGPGADYDTYLHFGPGELHLNQIEERLKHLITVEFPGEHAEKSRALTIARSKLQARLAEVQYLKGEFDAALTSYRAIIAVERNLPLRHKVRQSQAPVLGGRGIRSLARLLIDIARKRHGRRHSLVFRFVDGIAVSYPPLIENCWLIDLAERLLDTNIDRIPKDRIPDKIGVRIDKARVAVLRHDFVEALTHLSSAASGSFATGSSLELLLELMTVQARTLLDAAILCFVSNAEEMKPKGPAQAKARCPAAGDEKMDAQPFIYRQDGRNVDPETIAALGSYVGSGSAASPLRVAVALLGRSRESLATLYRLIEGHSGEHRPRLFEIDYKYLRQIQLALESRLYDTRTPAGEKKLEAAREELLEALGMVLAEMRGEGYLANEDEVDGLRRRLERANEPAAMPERDRTEVGKAAS